MAKSPHYKANNAGGLGNPPVDHQFKGKPGPGRPKGSKTLENALRKTFQQKIVRVGKDGKRSFVEAPEALAQRALELGLKGNLNANIEARKLAEKYGPEKNILLLDFKKFTEVELELYGYFLMKSLGPEPVEQEDLGPGAKRIIERIQKIIDEESSAERRERRRERTSNRSRG